MRLRLSIFLFFPLIVSANNAENQNINRFECASCHGGNSVNVPAEQALNVIDPTTGTAVTSFQAGKTYTIRIRFNNPNGSPWRNAYVLHIADIASGSPLRAGSIINNGNIGLVTDTGPTNPQSNSRIINSAVKNAVDNPEIQWQAPNDGRVRFQLLRMESNNATNQTGDRVSQTLESIVLPLFGSNNSNPSDGIAPSTSTNGSGTAFGNSSFSGELTAGCGRLAVEKNSRRPPVFVLFLVAVLFGFLCHRRSKLRD